MRRALTIAAVLLLTGCGATDPGGRVSTGAAALRGFSIEVDQAVAARVPAVRLRTCAAWGCHEQEVTLAISGPTVAAPCPRDAAKDTACGVRRLPGPGPGYGYAPVPALTFEAVTVTVSTPPGAPLPIAGELRVQPYPVCPGDPGPARAGESRAEVGESPARAAGEAGCAGATPQAGLRVAADGTVSQSR
jgi:hypothetical protein